MKTLVWIELVDGQPSDEGLGVLRRIEALGGESWVLLAGRGIEDAAAIVARYRCSGVLALETGDDAPDADALAVYIARVISNRGLTLFAAAASVFNTELAARLAVHAQAGILWGLTDLRLEDGQLVAVRATHGDAMRTRCRWQSATAVALFRQHECAASAPGETIAPIVPLSDDGLSRTRLTSVRRIVGERSGAASLADADIVVSGGRGLGQRDNLGLVHDLADALGGTAGVSLPLVDMGWAPRAMQVGQTGTVIAPRLYVACGISGQIQHKIGIERSGTIIAINTDSEAPIMKFCDLGIVGDIRIVLPALTSAIRTARGLPGTVS
jgi:electron transfer flavoprotein alpha subunit